MAVHLAVAGDVVNGVFFCCLSLVVLDEVCRFLSLFLLYINIKIGKVDVKC